MLSKIIQAGVRAVTSSDGLLRSWFSGHRSVVQAASSGAAVPLEDQYNESGGSGSGKVVRSLYHITAWAESEERILGTQQQGDSLAITRQLEVVVSSCTGPEDMADEVERKKTLGYVRQEEGVVGPSVECRSPC